ncbi:MAG: tRNA (guanosine(37)-N1)-methyltransferase TrmD [Myxococcota bacterium]
MLRIDVITIFPELFESFRRAGVLGGARERGVLELEAHDLRRFTRDRHRTVDDIPYGGGPGMVMKPEPLVEAIEALAGAKGPERKARVVLLTPQGMPFTGRRARELAREAQLVLVCGRYEGVDQRVIELAVDEEISIGDYVLSGGEVPAMAVIEAVSRFVPGVLGNPDSVASESFESDRLEGPHYTRPVEFRGLAVPEVLRSGDHARIARWRRQQGLERTQSRRPDLLTGGEER